MTKIKVPSKANLRIFWEDKAENYTQQRRKKVESYFRNKYGVKKVNLIFKPIKINEEEVTAYVNHIQPFLMGYRVLLSLGSYPIKEYIYKLNNFYIEEQRFEIEIIDGIDFKASKYFDISINRWNLDKLVPSVLEAHRRCKQIKNIDS